jgi:hypothetical protein
MYISKYLRDLLQLAERCNNLYSGNRRSYFKGILKIVQRGSGPYIKDLLNQKLHSGCTNFKGKSEEAAASSSKHAKKLTIERPPLYQRDSKIYLILRPLLFQRDSQ